MNLFDDGMEVDEQEWHAYLASLQKVKKAERIARPLTSFSEAGDSMLQLIANLHTSRVSAYGFTAEAEVLGTDEYAISEQLDARICPICAEMHGRVFKVSDARGLLEEVVKTQNPERLKDLQPWPKQDAKSVAEFQTLTKAQLIARGWHVPPYHPGCRGLLVHVGKVPKLKDVPDVLERIDDTSGPYIATTEDFRAYGLSLTPQQIETWNRQIGLPVGDVLSAVLGKTPQALLDEVAAKKIADAADIGIDSFKIGGETLEIVVRRNVFKQLIQYSVKVNAEASQVQVSIVDAEALIDYLDDLLESVMILTKRLEFESLLVTSEEAILAEAAILSGLPTPYFAVSVSPKRILVARK